MPAQAKVHELRRAAIFLEMLHQIETGAEMRPLAPQHHRAHARLRDRGEKVDQLPHRLRIQRVALGFAVQRHRRDPQIVHVEQNLCQIKAVERFHATSPSAGAE